MKDSKHCRVQQELLVLGCLPYTWLIPVQTYCLKHILGEKKREIRDRQTDRQTELTDRTERDKERNDKLSIETKHDGIKTNASVVTSVVDCFSFNRLDMPKYETHVKMYEKLTCAVEETLGFSVE